MLQEGDGETPLKYMTGLRINEAKRMLVTHENMDIKTIGGAVGYSDSHYFSRIFKNKTGMYPSEYRLQLQERKKPCPWMMSTMLT